MRLNVHFGDHRVGELLELEHGAWFQFDNEWLGLGIEISPINLPATSGVLGPWNDSEQYFLAGVFADSLPDKYGRAVIMRRFRDIGLREPSPLEMLAYLGSRTMGALTYLPSSGEPDFNRSVDLIAAAVSARNVVELDFESEVDGQIIASGGSAGGAQPKILVAIDEVRKRIVTGADEIPEGMGAWLLKLDVDGEKSIKQAMVEQAYFLMGRAAGIDVPDTMLIPSSDGATHFAIRRFDREFDSPNRRVHMHTLSGMLHVGFSDERWDYDHLLSATRRVTMHMGEVEAAWRRMLFNVLSHNQDDHSKNFSFLMNDHGGWSLAPAYDLTYCRSLHGGQAMRINGKRLYQGEDITDLGHKHSITAARMKEIYDEVSGAVAKWTDFASEAGLPEGRALAIEGGINEVRDRLKFQFSRRRLSR